MFRIWHQTSIWDFEDRMESDFHQQSVNHQHPRDLHQNKDLLETQDMMMEMMMMMMMMETLGEDGRTTGKRTT